MQKNNDLILDIVDNGMKLEGIAKCGNIPVFVPYAIKGETIKARVIKVNTNYAIGKLTEIVKQSKYRVQSDCPVFDKCGGCVARHIEYAETLRIKKQNVVNLLKKQSINTNVVGNICGMGNPYYYRNKVQYPIVNINGQMHMGMYAFLSHRLVEFDTCLIQNQIIDKIAHELFERLKKYNFNGYKEDNTGDIRNIICRIGVNTGEVMCVLVINNSSLVNDERISKIAKDMIGQYSYIKSFCLVVNDKVGNTILTDEVYTVWGQKHITDIIGDYTFEITADSFFQVNTYQAEILYNLLKERLNLQENQKENLLELYSGVGSIGIFLSKFVNKVYGVEIVESAVESAKNNCRINQIKNAQYVCADASTYIKDVKKETIDILVVDPPRKGLEQAGIETILEVESRKIGYISCNPATLVRDLKLLSCKYEIESIDLVDMFPFTAHVETIALLCRE